jgi:hypothetical protein
LVLYDQPGGLRRSHSQTSKPEVHWFFGRPPTVSRDIARKTWILLDANFLWSGVTSLNGIENLATKQTGSRMGGTVAWRFSKHQSLKASYSDGTYVRFGGNYQSACQVAWQYSWLDWSKTK